MLQIFQTPINYKLKVYERVRHLEFKGRLVGYINKKEVVIETAQFLKLPFDENIMTDLDVRIEDFYNEFEGVKGAVGSFMETIQGVLILDSVTNNIKKSCTIKQDVIEEE